MAKIKIITLVGFIVLFVVTYFRLPSRAFKLIHRTEARDTLSNDIIDWDKRFWFVPNNVERCTELFNGKASITQHIMEECKLYASAFRKITNHSKLAEGFTARIQSAFKAYLELASHPSVKTICETGFNGGHSTFGWLTVNPHAHVYSFDIGVHPYAKPMAEYLQRLFPGRLDMTWGDSTKTLPDFRRQHPNVTCDLMIIDGGHTTPICKSDLLNFRLMASRENVVILDNYPQKSWNFDKKLGDVWEWAKRNGKVSEIFKCQVKEKTPDFGFSVGRYIISGKC